METILNVNVTEPAVLRILIRIAECRYIDFKTIKSVNNRDTRTVASKQTLAKLLNRGFLILGDNNSYNITVKSLKLIKEKGFATDHISSNFKGSFNSHQQKLTANLWPVMWGEDYFHTFYPIFNQNGKPFLIPDACLIFKRPSGEYKIDFVEVEESDKPDDYLIQKAEKYKVIFGDMNIWDKWWRHWSGVFGLKFPEIEKLKFTVRQYGGKPNGTFKFMGE